MTKLRTWCLVILGFAAPGALAAPREPVQVVTFKGESPPDTATETPTIYVRDCEGLTQERLQQMKALAYLNFHPYTDFAKIVELTAMRGITRPEQKKPQETRASPHLTELDVEILKFRNNELRSIDFLTETLYRLAPGNVCAEFLRASFHIRAFVLMGGADYGGNYPAYLQLKRAEEITDDMFTLHNETELPYIPMLAIAKQVGDPGSLMQTYAFSLAKFSENMTFRLKAEHLSYQLYSGDVGPGGYLVGLKEAAADGSPGNNPDYLGTILSLASMRVARPLNKESASPIVPIAEIMINLRNLEIVNPKVRGILAAQSYIQETNGLYDQALKSIIEESRLTPYKDSATLYNTALLSFKKNQALDAYRAITELSKTYGHVFEVDDRLSITPFVFVASSLRDPPGSYAAIREVRQLVAERGQAGFYSSIFSAETERLAPAACAFTPVSGLAKTAAGGPANTARCSVKGLSKKIVKNLKNHCLASVAEFYAINKTMYQDGFVPELALVGVRRALGIDRNCSRLPGMKKTVQEVNESASALWNDSWLFFDRLWTIEKYGYITDTVISKAALGDKAGITYFFEALAASVHGTNKDFLHGYEILITLHSGALSRAKELAVLLTPGEKAQILEFLSGHRKATDSDEFETWFSDLHKPEDK